MSTNIPRNEGAVEFEEFLGRAEIQLTKVLTTPEGENLRIVITSGDTAVITALGDPSGDTVIVTGELPTDRVVYFSIWGGIKKIGSFIKNLVVGQKCTTTTTTKIRSNGTIESITTTTTCT